MSLKLLNQVFGLKAKATPAERIVLAYLSFCFNDKTRDCHPNVDTVARKTGLTRQGTRNAINGLCRKGLLIKVNVRKFHGNGYRYIPLPSNTTGQHNLPVDGATEFTCPPPTTGQKISPQQGNAIYLDRTTDLPLSKSESKTENNSVCVIGTHSQSQLWLTPEEITCLARGDGVNDPIPKRFVLEKLTEWQASKGMANNKQVTPQNASILIRKWWTCERHKNLYIDTIQKTNIGEATMNVSDCEVSSILNGELK